MSKKYRQPAVAAAVQNWDLSDWFTADQLLPRVMEELPQRTMSINVYSVSRFLRIMESRGQLLSRTAKGIKEFHRMDEGAYEDGNSHFYA
jgi:hypothetical protein